MSRIRSRGNRDTELALVALFRRLGITGWRRHWEIRSPKFEVRIKSEGRKPKPGRAHPASGIRHPASGITPFRVHPDFVFPKLRLAVFVDGCFWHGCPRHGNQPANHRAFWRRKLAANVARDRRVNRALRVTGWRVLRIWEHALARRQEARLARRIWRFLNASAVLR
jgi:DNA mismatch endonuclease (patch repair protein)